LSVNSFQHFHENDLTMRRTIHFLLFTLVLISSFQGKAQILFAEDCFVGGVQTGGHSSIGSLIGGSFSIHWEAGYNLRQAYAICYRYGRPDPYTFFVNGSPISWTMDSQAGPELIEENPSTDYFAVHVMDITEDLVLTSDQVSIDLPSQTLFEQNPNWGWWGVYIIIHYESPDISDEICSRVYLADQSQNSFQNYSFETPDFSLNSPILLAIYSGRLANFFADASSVILNDQFIGNIWSGDLVNPISSFGVQGHYFYQNGIIEGLNGDTANTSMEKHDGIAVINDLISNEPSQNLILSPINSFQDNPHPAFLLTYTPECEVVAEEMLGQYKFCRGDSVQLTALSGYDTYTWSKEEGLSDSTIANPWCSADSSGWYTLSMESDDGGLCPQTIPVFVEIYDNPVPDPLTVRASVCPANTGRVIANNTPGNLPINYTLNATENTTGTFNDLAPGNYDLSVETATGCQWDTSVVVPLNPVHEASFTATPELGYSPLDVFFTNTSTQATGYQWQIDGVPVSESEDITYTFPDSGSFTVSLIAYRLEESCADTATFTLRVEPGIRVLMPNVITPNGDGRNDALVAQVSGLASARWTIFTRWGNEVASGAEAAPAESLALWTPESDLPDGQYTVVLVAAGLDGKVERFVFEVAVVR
jgi:hypothetical protein